MLLVARELGAGCPEVAVTSRRHEGNSAYPNIGQLRASVPVEGMNEAIPASKVRVSALVLLLSHCHLRPQCNRYNIDDHTRRCE